MFNTVSAAYNLHMLNIPELGDFMVFGNVLVRLGSPV